MREQGCTQRKLATRQSRVERLLRAEKEKKKVVGREGLEPSTNGLKGRQSEIRKSLAISIL